MPRGRLGNPSRPAQRRGCSLPHRRYGGMVKEIGLNRPGLSADAGSFLACLATILELPESDVPEVGGNGDPSEDWNVLAWLGALGVGLVPVAHPRTFAWPGPWIARVRGVDG